jgi:hypothetical protein
MINNQQQRPALLAMYVGITLTAVATIAPYVDRATGEGLAAHIRDGYPAYSQARIDTAVTTWLVILSIVGVLGIASWLTTVWAVRAGKGWARWLAAGLFAAGTSIALTALLVKDTSGDTGLTTTLGLLGTLPSVAGLAAVIALWRKSNAVRQPSESQIGTARVRNIKSCLCQQTASTGSSCRGPA